MSRASPHFLKHIATYNASPDNIVRSLIICLFVCLFVCLFFCSAGSAWRCASVRSCWHIFQSARSHSGLQIIDRKWLKRLFSSCSLCFRRDFVQEHRLFDDIGRKAALPATLPPPKKNKLCKSERSSKEWRKNCYLSGKGGPSFRGRARNRKRWWRVWDSWL